MKTGQFGNRVTIFLYVIAGYISCFEAGCIGWYYLIPALMWLLGAWFGAKTLVHETRIELYRRWRIEGK